jgi:hypothetical protein
MFFEIIKIYNLQASIELDILKKNILKLGKQHYIGYELLRSLRNTC